MSKLRFAVWAAALAAAVCSPRAPWGAVTGSGLSLSSLLGPKPGACVESDICIRFLWPADAGRPGRERLELSAQMESAVSETETPLGRMETRRIRWNLPSGEPAAETRVYALPEAEAGRAWVIQTEVKQEISAATGEFNRPAFAAPALTPPSSLRRVLTFQMTAFSPPIRKPIPTSGPVVLYNDKLQALVFSPLDHFLAAIQSPERGEWLCGFEGEVERIPAGTVYRTLIVQGQGITQTLLRWGELLQAWHGHQRPSADADVGLQYLGYWTDNGAMYYYRTAPGLNYHQTLMAVRKDGIERDIPYGYFQIDSWWYPKAEGKGLLSAARGGALRWEPIPEMFPQGLPAFQQELKLPLVAHNRWYDRNSPYCQRYECVYGEGDRNAALPIDPEFWDEIMGNAVKYGVRVYEQDWLDTQYDMIPWLRSGLGHAESWFDTLVKTAAGHGLTMQLCMASPGFFLEQVKFPNVTTVRASGDYLAGLPKTFFWRDFHQTSLFAYAVGLWPFKDNFQSASGQRRVRNERWPYEEALISILSAGMVGPSDRIGAADRELLMKTCRRDGVLLKPDRPAFPIDLMFLDTRKPWIVTTRSSHSIGDTYYLAAFNILGQTDSDRSVSLADLGLTGKYLLYNYRTGRAGPEPALIKFGRLPLNDAFYCVLCPLLENGAALIGETAKFVTMSRKRFPSARFAEGKLKLEVEGVPGEEVVVSLYSPGPPRPAMAGEPLETKKQDDRLYSLTVLIPDSGRAAVEIEF